ncbi:MAG: hydrolase TatD [Nevskiaceae bacterium]|nr:MAG: hydrolase TatD [Nevskiaceae bacterium]TBR73543.1 MAG: hydrolase TatD [Nevskiaceae bacterium]
MTQALSTAPFIDIGANLAHDSFDADRGAVLERAWAAGLAAILVTGSDAASNDRAAELARALPGRLFATAGLHPHHAAAWDETLAAQIATLSTREEVVAVGECGLDYFRDLSPRDAQRRAFVAQLGLAVQANKPVFLHQRDAHEDFHAILRDYRKALAGCVVHCFTDTAAALDDYLALDCHVGITGWVCDERRGLDLRELVKRIPADRLLIETDAPYLLPRTMQPLPPSRRNEPAFLPWVLRAIAAARGEDAEILAVQTTANARRLFGLPVSA